MCYTVKPTGKFAIGEEEIKELFARAKKQPRATPQLDKAVTLLQQPKCLDFLMKFKTPRFQGGGLNKRILTRAEE